MIKNPNAYELQDILKDPRKFVNYDARAGIEGPIPIEQVIRDISTPVQIPAPHPLARKARRVKRKAGK